MHELGLEIRELKISMRVYNSQYKQRHNLNLKKELRNKC